jgi:hypothetical protein
VQWITDAAIPIALGLVSAFGATWYSNRKNAEKLERQANDRAADAIRAYIRVLHETWWGSNSCELLSAVAFRSCARRAFTPSPCRVGDTVEIEAAIAEVPMSFRRIFQAAFWPRRLCFPARLYARARHRRP